MKYTVVLTGNAKIVVDEKQRERIKQLMLSGDEETILVGNEIIKTSAIKGVFEIKDDGNTDFTADIQKINREFNENCTQMAKLPIDEKITNEMTIRIFPVKFLEKGWIKYDDKLAEGVKSLVTRYFTKYKNMPRCPAKIWWPLLKDHVEKNTWTERFYDYVSRNDGEIYRWAKYDKENQEAKQIFS